MNHYVVAAMPDGAISSYVITCEEMVGSALDE